MKINLSFIFILLFISNLACQTSNTSSVVQNDMTYGKKVKLDFYGFVSNDTLKSVQGNPKIIETQVYYDDLKEWAWEDSSLYDANGRLVYFNNYHDVKSIIYNGNNLMYYSRKDSEEETYVYWFFYDSFNNPTHKIIAVKNNPTNQYRIYEVVKYTTQYYKDSVVINEKSSNEFLVNEDGITYVFNKFGNIINERYLNKKGVLVSKFYTYQKVKNDYILIEEKDEFTKEYAVLKKTTKYTIDENGTILREEMQTDNLISSLNEKSISTYNFLSDNTKQIIRDYYNHNSLQSSYYFEFDKFGNMTIDSHYNYPDKYASYISLYDYKLDAKNNWTIKNEYIQEMNENNKPIKKKMNVVTYSRKITYYNKEEKYIPQNIPVIPGLLMQEVNQLLEKLK